MQLAATDSSVFDQTSQQNMELLLKIQFGYSLVELSSMLDSTSANHKHSITYKGPAVILFEAPISSHFEENRR